MGPEEEYTTDIIDIARVPIEATKEELLDFMKKEDIDVAPENLITTQFAETWRILDIPSSDVMKAIVKRCHGRRFQGRNLLFLPVQLPTPMKKRAEVPPTDPATEPSPAAAPSPEAAPKPPTADELKEATEREKARLALEKVQKYNEEVARKAELREEAERKRRRDEMEKEKERLRKQGVEAERAEGESSSRRSGASEGTGGPAVASGEEVETQVSPNKVQSNTAMNVLNTVKNIFGINKSSIPPEAEVNKSNVVQETPIFQKKAPKFVKETPAVDVVSASPVLASSKREEELDGDDSVNTIDSQDEIFGTTIVGELDIQPFKSQFAQEIERRHSFSKEVTSTKPRPQRAALRRPVATDVRPRLNSFGFQEKRDRIQVGSQSSGDGEEQPEPEKDKSPPGEEGEEVDKTPAISTNLPFGMVLTKNQKKKLKKREAKKLREEGSSPTKKH